MLTLQQIEEIVDKAVAGEGALSRMMDKALFPNRYPRKWGDYSPEQKAAWDKAVELYDSKVERTGRRQYKARRPNARTVSVEEAWQAVMESILEADPKKRLTWRSIGDLLGIHMRAAQYQLTAKLGFVIEGDYPTRFLTAGPCLACTETVPLDDLHHSFCNNCLLEGVDDESSDGPVEWSGFGPDSDLDVAG